MAYQVRLYGGACDGRTVNVQTSPPVLGKTSCGGDVYVFVAGHFNPYVFQLEADFAENVPLSSYGGGGTVSAAGDRQVTAQWTRLMRVLGVNGPAQIRRASAATARIRARVR